MSTEYETAEAIRALRSSIGKCEKARARLREGSPQRKWVDRQLEAFRVAVALMEDSPPPERCAAPTLRAAGETCALLIARCEKLPAKFSDGSPQRTLAIRRLQALQIAKSLIAQELEDFHGKKTP